jgi:hypothetical protein
VRIGAADERNVGREHVELREQVGEAAAGVPIVVPQETIVLIQQVGCVDLFREYQSRRLWRRVTPWGEYEAQSVDCIRDQRVTVREWVIPPACNRRAQSQAQNNSDSIQVFVSLSRFRLYRQIEQLPFPPVAKAIDAG